MAHGELPPEVGPRRLICVFVTPVTEFLLHFGRDLGYETIMMDPDSSRLAWAEWRYADQIYSVPTEEFVDRTTDVVVTDHDREELGRHWSRSCAYRPGISASWAASGTPRPTSRHCASSACRNR